MHEHVEQDIAPDPPELLPNDEPRSNWTNTGVGASIAGLLVAAEVLPVNIFASTAAEAVWHNPNIVTGVLAGATALTEVAGSICTVDLLRGRAGSKLTSLYHKLTHKAHIEDKKTSKPFDLFVAMTAGTSTMSAIKLMQDPESTRSSNIRYGTLMALGTSALYGAQGWLVSEGLPHPNTITEGVALSGLSVILGAVGWLRQRMPRRKREAPETTVEQTPLESVPTLGLVENEA